MSTTAISPTDRPNSVFHLAARFAVFAIIFAFVVKFISAQIPTTIGGWLSIIADIVGFCAVPAGIVALSGIPRHGKKELLWKGLIGVLVPVVLFVAGIMIALLLREQAKELMEKANAK